MAPQAEAAGATAAPVCTPGLLNLYKLTSLYLRQQERRNLALKASFGSCRSCIATAVGRWHH